MQANDGSKIIASFWNGCQHRPPQNNNNTKNVKNRSQTKKLNRNSAAVLITSTWSALITYLGQPRPSLPACHTSTFALQSSSPPTPLSSLASPSVRAPRKGEIESDTLTLLLLRFHAAVIGNVRIAQNRPLTSVLARFLFVCMQQHRWTFFRFWCSLYARCWGFQFCHGHSWLKLAVNGDKILLLLSERSLLGTSRISVLCWVSCTVFSLFFPRARALSLSLFMLSISCYLYPSARSLSVPVAQSQRTVHGAQVSNTEPDRIQSSARQREAQPWIQYF